MKRIIETLALVLLAAAAAIAGENDPSAWGLWADDPPAPPAQREPSLADRFQTLDDLLDAGHTGRAVVFTAPRWCRPCQQLEPELHKLNGSESFSGRLQVVDIERWPQLWQMVSRERRTNLVPLVVYRDNAGRLQSVAGFHTASWLRSISTPPEAGD